MFSEELVSSIILPQEMGTSASFPERCKWALLFSMGTLVSYVVIALISLKKLPTTFNGLSSKYRVRIAHSVFSSCDIVFGRRN